MIAGMSRNAAGRPTSSTHVPWPGLRRPVRLVLLAADADPDNRAVVDRAIAIAIREHAELVAVHILPADHGLPLDAGDGPVPPELDRIVLRARAVGAKARHLVRSGDTGPTILDAARRLNADLIVMGGGGACGHVLAHSDRPVLVVQSWAEADPGWDDPFPQDRAQPRTAVETGRGIASAPSVSPQEAGEQRIPVMNDRVACRLLGEVELNRCLECGHLIRLEPGLPGSSTPRQVICLDRGPSLGEDLSW
jgi:nucleotide-binding universal stress UspA family protein